MKNKKTIDDYRFELNMYLRKAGLEEPSDFIEKLFFIQENLFVKIKFKFVKFKNKICLEYGEEHKNAKRHIDWKRGEPYTYRIDDYHELMNCDEFFARKFSSIQ